MTENQHTEQHEDVLEQPAEAAAEATDQPADDWKDKAYRLAAEMENLKKRTQRDVDEARKYAISGFARELLNVQDNMERALSAAENIEEGSSDAVKSMSEGVKMISEQLTSALEKMQIKRIENPVGSKPNPELHQVVVEIPTADAAEGTVVQEIQAGYMIADRLLRPSMVGTAKAPAAE